MYKTFDNRTLLEEALADKTLQLLQQGIDQRGTASLIVSGGSTPVALFEKLSQRDFNWNRVIISLADERWVSVDSEESNQHLVQTHLLQNKASGATFIGLHSGHATPHQAQAEIEQRLKAIHRPFDLVLLGMGNDGHTASLFPESIELLEAIDDQSPHICQGITPVTAPHLRMTMTLPYLLDSKEIILHITGEQKHKVYQQAMEGTDIHDMPIRAVLQQTRTPISVYWAA